MIGRVERNHLFGQRFCARKDRSQRIDNRHQGHGNTPVYFLRMIFSENRFPLFRIMR
jgi:hypothetical protein